MRRAKMAGIWALTAGGYVAGIATIIKTIEIGTITSHDLTCERKILHKSFLLLAHFT
jgi:hypothetical protein